MSLSTIFRPCRRAAGGTRSRSDRSPRAEGETDERRREYHDRRTVMPDQREQRRMVAFGEEVHIVAASQFRSADEQWPVIGFEQGPIAKRVAIDHGHAATAYRDADDVNISPVENSPRGAPVLGARTRARA